MLSSKYNLNHNFLSELRDSQIVICPRFSFSDILDFHSRSSFECVQCKIRANNRYLHQQNNLKYLETSSHYSISSKTSTISIKPRSSMKSFKNMRQKYYNVIHAYQTGFLITQKMTRLNWFAS